MPKSASPALVWSSTQQCYELQTEHGKKRCISPRDDDFWFSWLHRQKSFSFQGQAGHLSLLKESRERGDGYWYAYRSHNGKTMKKYLGRTDALSLEHLEEAAQALASQQDNQLAPSLKNAPASEVVLPLLQPKLRLPRPRSFLLPRTHLLSRLDASLERRLTLILAPAGSGKTTLISSWISRLQRQKRISVAWLSLDAGDNNPVRFWRYMIAACQSLHPELKQAFYTLTHVWGEVAFDMEQSLFVVTTLLNELNNCSENAVLVLEDYHDITSPLIHKALAAFIDHIPPTLHVVILTRTEPSLPLARLRASNELSEIFAADLRFSIQETEAYLQHTLTFPLPPGIAIILTERTEGWAVGIQLATLVLQGKSNPLEIEQVLAHFSGGQRHVLEYLLVEVLASQPEHIQTFLLQTSLLNRLTASLCDAITDSSSGEQLLDHLARSHLFLVPLDETGQWYRYHTLFAEAMRQEARRRFGPDALMSLALTAAHWYEAHTMQDEAIECLLSADAFELAASLIEQYAASVLRFHGIEEITTLRRWLETLPKKVLHAYPSLCFAQAFTLLFSLDRHAPSTHALVEASLQKSEQIWQAEGDQQMLGTVLTLRSLMVGWQGDLARAFSLSHQALALLPPQEMQWRGISLLHVGKEALLMGRLHEAHKFFTEGSACCRTTHNTFALLATTITLGNVCFAQGELRQARHYYQHISLLIAEKWPDLPATRHPARDDHTLALIGLAQLSYEWNELDRAEQQASQALAIATQLNEEHLAIPASLVLARVWQARGELTRAQQLIQEKNTAASSSWLSRSVLLEQAWLALVADEQELAERTLASYSRYTEHIAHLEQEQYALLVARLQIAQGRTTEALTSLKSWLSEAKAMGRTRSEIQLLSSIAQAYLADEELAQAQSLLLQALTLAYPTGHCRIFLDAGKYMPTLLRKTLSVASDEPVHSYLRSLLLAATEPSASIPAPHSLSPQELRVLHLLASGYSRAQIAQELVVSINTVKTQLHSIYHKLHVTNRKEAYTVAKHLNLL